MQKNNLFFLLFFRIVLKALEIVDQLLCMNIIVVLDLIFSYLNWSELALVCQLCYGYNVFNTVSTKTLQRILWFNSSIIRECMGYNGLRKLSCGVLRDLTYSPDLLTDLYFEIVRKKFEERRNETNHGLARSSNWIVDVLFPPKVDKNGYITSVSFNPTYDLMAFVSQDWLSFTFSICSFGCDIKGKTGKTIYHFTSVPQYCNSLLLKWSPNGKFLIAFEIYDRKKICVANLFQFFPSTGVFRQLKTDFPPLNSQLQTSHCWLSNASFLLIPTESTLVRDQGLKVYSIDESKNTITVKNHKLSALKWKWIGLITVCPFSSNQFFFVDICDTAGHDYHHKIIQAQLCDVTSVVKIKFVYEFAGFIVDMSADHVGKLTYAFRQNRRQDFDNFSILPRIGHASTFKKCHFVNPRPKKSYIPSSESILPDFNSCVNGGTYTLFLGEIDAVNNKAKIFNHCKNVSLGSNHYTEEIQSVSNDEVFDTNLFFRNIVKRACITSNTDQLVVLSHFVFLRSIPFAYSDSTFSMYHRHPTKPFFISKSKVSNNNVVEVCLTPVASHEFKKKYPKSRSFEYNGAKRIKLIKE